MEIVLKRFPHAGKMILKNLNDQSLVRSKEAVIGMTNFFNRSKYDHLRFNLVYGNKKG